MYGIIHKALKDMVIRDFGQEKWREIEKATGKSDDVYVSMQTYPDEITYGLIGAASKVLGAPIETCLEMFGEYWVLEAAPGSYSHILDATGDQIVKFIRNINSLHDRITSTFSEYVPPEFYIKDIGSDLYRIHYVSTREGLSHFVVGLLKGLGVRFNCELEIISIERLESEFGEEWAFNVRIPIPTH